MTQANKANNPKLFLKIASYEVCKLIHSEVYLLTTKQTPTQNLNPIPQTHNPNS